MVARVARYLVNEDVSPKPIGLMRQLGYDIERVPGGTQDPDIIELLGDQHGSKGVWITADKSAITDHRNKIKSAGISIAILDVNNALRDTQCFMIFSFVYRRRGLTETANSPLYFKLNVRGSRLDPNVTIRSFNL